MKATKKKHKICLWRICLVGILLCVAYIYVKESVIDCILANKGIQGVAYVYHINPHKGGGTYYHFYYPDTWYLWKGSAHGKPKLKLGQACVVIFLPDNPKINRRWDEIKTKRKAKERIAKGELCP